MLQLNKKPTIYQLKFNISNMELECYFYNKPN